jgi:hypothetical protein
VKINGQELQRRRRLNRYLRAHILRCSEQQGADMLKSVFPQANIEVGQTGSCPRCGNLVSCTCSIAKKHAADCCYRKAAELPFELACEHGFQACPVCDPCACSIGVVGGVR